MEHCLYSMIDELIKDYDISLINIVIIDFLNNKKMISTTILERIIYIYDLESINDMKNYKNYDEFDKAFFLALFCRRNNLLNDLEKIVNDYNGEYKKYLDILLKNPECEDKHYIYRSHKYYWAQQYLLYLNKKFYR